MHEDLIISTSCHSLCLAILFKSFYLISKPDDPEAHFSSSPISVSSLFWFFYLPSGFYFLHTIMRRRMVYMQKNYTFSSILTSETLFPLVSMHWTEPLPKVLRVSFKPSFPSLFTVAFQKVSKCLTYCWYLYDALFPEIIVKNMGSTETCSSCVVLSYLTLSNLTTIYTVPTLPGTMQDEINRRCDVLFCQDRHGENILN